MCNCSLHAIKYDTKFINSPFSGGSNYKQLQKMKWKFNESQCIYLKTHSQNPPIIHTWHHPLMIVKQNSRNKCPCKKKKKHH